VRGNAELCQELRALRAGPALAGRLQQENAEPAEAGCRVDFANTHYVNIPPWSERYVVDDANHRPSVGKVSYEFDPLDRPINKFNEPAVAEPAYVLTYDGAGNPTRFNSIEFVNGTMIRAASLASN
jgi:hypothetical protein